jgi:hypothetical protein
MQHKAKVDWWIGAALLVTVVVPLFDRRYWASGLTLLLLLVFAYPQSYETTSDGLLIQAGLIRKLIPYAAITAICPGSGRPSGLAWSLPLSMDRVSIQYGKGKEAVIAPADQDAFLADVAMRTPQLVKRGFDLVLSI